MRAESSIEGSSIEDTPRPPPPPRRRRRQKPVTPGAPFQDPTVGPSPFLNGAAAAPEVAEEQAQPAGQEASPTTLAAFKHIMFCFGLVTTGFAIALMTIDLMEVGTRKEIKGKVVDLPGKPSDVLINAGLMFGAGGLLILHWFFPRAIFILLLGVISPTHLIVRIFLAPLYHIELMWLVVLNMLISWIYMYIIWMDCQAVDDDACSAITKNRSGPVEDPQLTLQGKMMAEKVDGATTPAMPLKGAATATPGAPPAPEETGSSSEEQQPESDVQQRERKRRSHKSSSKSRKRKHSKRSRPRDEEVGSDKKRRSSSKKRRHKEEDTSTAADGEQKKRRSHSSKKKRRSEKTEVSTLPADSLAADSLAIR